VTIALVIAKYIYCPEMSLYAFNTIMSPSLNVTSTDDTDDAGYIKLNSVPEISNPRVGIVRVTGSEETLITQMAPLNVVL
jgi:hypothetical protein